MIFAIDPGPVESAWVLYQDDVQACPRNEALRDFAKQGNNEVIERLRFHAPAQHLVIEKIASFGMPVGAEVFETVYWSGRFAEAFGATRVSRITRPTVKMHLCHSMRAKDANIRQALIDRFGEPGTKKNPGMLYGVSGDVWSALAVAVTFTDQRKSDLVELFSSTEVANG